MKNGGAREEVSTAAFATVGSREEEGASGISGTAREEERRRLGRQVQGGGEDRPSFLARGLKCGDPREEERDRRFHNVGLREEEETVRIGHPAGDHRDPWGRYLVGGTLREEEEGATDLRGPGRRRGPLRNLFAVGRFLRHAGNHRTVQA